MMTLQRFEYCADYVVGRIYDDQDFIAFTIEGVSDLLPCGEYLLSYEENKVCLGGQCLEVGAAWMGNRKLRYTGGAQAVLLDKLFRSEHQICPILILEGKS